MTNSCVQYARPRFGLRSFGFVSSFVIRISSFMMIFLQASHPNSSFLQRTDSIRACKRGADRRHDWNFRRKRSISDDHFVLARNFPARRVDDEIDVAVLNPIEHVWSSLVNLEHFGYL